MNTNNISTSTIDFDEHSNDISGELFVQNNDIKTNIVSIPEQETIGKIYNLETEISPFISTEQSWEGYVLKVLEDSFIARLTDLNNKNVTDQMEIKKIAITDQDDEVLVKEGAVFFWEIARKRDGKKRDLVSTIKFRRLPIWTEKEINIARKEANEIADKIGW